MPTESSVSRYDYSVSDRCTLQIAPSAQAPDRAARVTRAANLRASLDIDQRQILADILEYREPTCRGDRTLLTPLLIAGRPGTGKSHLFDTIRCVLEAEGWGVLAGATTNAAAALVEGDTVDAARKRRVRA